jgi:hypothetical protein
LHGAHVRAVATAGFGLCCDCAVQVAELFGQSRCGQNVRAPDLGSRRFALAELEE